MRCRFCFATFRDVPGHLSRDEAIRLVELLTERFDKITFAGGEPTLCPWLPELVKMAHTRGCTTMLVTNGSRLGAMLPELAPHLDWVTLSIDTDKPLIGLALGRAVPGRSVLRDHDLIALAQQVRAANIRLKLNSVITSLQKDDDMTSFLLQLRPERWKIFQVLPVTGQNDTMDPSLYIDLIHFQRFVDRHRPLEEHGIKVVAEENEDMRGSYAMIDPLGRFFDNASGCHTYSEPILKIGIDLAWDEIYFDYNRFEGRGGIYNWKELEETE